MPSPSNPIRGSERSPLPGARAIGPADANERLEVTVQVRPRSGARFAALAKDIAEGRAPKASGGHMTHEEVEQAHAADPGDLGKVEAFAKEHGLALLERSAALRAI